MPLSDALSARIPRALRRTPLLKVLVAAFALLAASLVYLLVSDDASAGATTLVATATALTGIAVGATAFVSQLESLRRGRIHDVHATDLLVANLTTEDVFVDRGREMRSLLASVSKAACISCHGQQGAGKSHLLAGLADVINGHRPVDHTPPTRPRATAALYFDLADTAGFDDFLHQVGGALGDEFESWSQFVRRVDREFGQHRVVLILDNVNARELWPALGRATYEYRAVRPADAVVVGSIDALVVHNLAFDYLEISPFDRAAVEALVRSAEEDPTPEVVTALFDDSGGLPLLLKLLLADRRVSALPRDSAVQAFIADRVLPDLTPGTRLAVSYIALLCLTRRANAVAALERLPIADLDDHLRVAARRSLITRRMQSGSDVVKMHDLVRDTWFRLAEDDVAEAATTLIRYAVNEGRLVDACILALFAQAEKVEPVWRDAMPAVVQQAVEDRNYTLLATLHDRSRQRQAIVSFIAANEPRQDLFRFARASQLAGSGRYSEAEGELLATSGLRQRLDAAGVERPPLDLDIRFLLADVTHLQNRYDEAAEMFGELAEYADHADDLRLRAMSLWGVGHVLRHQGRDFRTALDMFADAAAAADICGSLFASVYSITNASGIRVFLGDIPDNEEWTLQALERAVEKEATAKTFLLEVWKSQAQVAWARGLHDLAAATVAKGIDESLRLNDRLLFNFYFERAEFRRLSGDMQAAEADYETVLRFGSANGDRNLSANALLGLIASEIQASNWFHFGSRERTREGALRARDLASAADIQATVETATRLIAAIDEPDRDNADDLRLILF